MLQKYTQAPTFEREKKNIEERESLIKDTNGGSKDALTCPNSTANHQVKEVQSDIYKQQ